MDKKTWFHICMLVSIIVLSWIFVTSLPVEAYAKTIEDEPEIIEVVTIYDEAGHRGTATISHVRVTFNIEVALPDGEVVKVDNWRTAKYDADDIKAVSDKIYSVCDYVPPKHANRRITVKIFSW